MNKGKIVRWTVVAGVVGATALGAALYAAFPAQAASLSAGVRSIIQFGYGGAVDWWALLAEELGISVDELGQAVEAANSAAIDQLVEQGVLTEDQGELARAANALRSVLDQKAILAEALGISPEELQQALEDGSTLSDLLEQHGLDRATYRENLAAAYGAAVQAAVADGVITQDQADELQSRGWFHGFGRRQGPGFGPGGFGPGFGPGRGTGARFTAPSIES